MQSLGRQMKRRSVPSADLPAAAPDVQPPSAATNSQNRTVEPASAAGLTAAVPQGSRSTSSTAAALVVEKEKSFTMESVRKRTPLPRSTRRRRSPLQTTPAVNSNASKHPMVGTPVNGEPASRIPSQSVSQAIPLQTPALKSPPAGSGSNVKQPVPQTQEDHKRQTDSDVEGVRPQRLA